MWNGTEAGWTIQVTRHNQHGVFVAFGDLGASVADVAKLRQLTEEYRDLSAIEARAIVGRRRADLGLRSEIEARELECDGRELGLIVELECRSETSYLPVNELTNMTLIIEDDGLARRVCEEAIARGVKVVQVEVC